jgi:hypothetical protein
MSFLILTISVRLSNLNLFCYFEVGMINVDTKLLMENEKQNYIFFLYSAMSNRKLRNLFNALFMCHTFSLRRNLYQVVFFVAVILGRRLRL